jgi:hypothetical protein
MSSRQKRSHSRPFKGSEFSAQGSRRSVALSGEADEPRQLREEASVGASTLYSGVAGHHEAAARLELFLPETGSAI